VVEKNIYECINDKCVTQTNINILKSMVLYRGFETYCILQMFLNSWYFTEVSKLMVVAKSFKHT